MKGLKFEKLREYPTCVAVGPRHPFAKLKSVSPKQVAAEPLLAYTRADYPDYHAMIEEVFRPLGVKPCVVEEHVSAPGLIAATEAGRGISLAASVLAIVAGGRIKLIPLKPAPAPLAVGAVYNPKCLSSAAREILLQAAGRLKAKLVFGLSLTLALSPRRGGTCVQRLRTADLSRCEPRAICAMFGENPTSPGERIQVKAIFALTLSHLHQVARFL